MLAPLLLNTALTFTLTNPTQEAFSNIFYKPTENMTAIIVLALAFVALAALAIYMVRKLYERCQTT